MPLTSRSAGAAQSLQARLGGENQEFPDVKHSEKEYSKDPHTFESSKSMVVGTEALGGSV
jgi:hypothetical protein